MDSKAHDIRNTLCCARYGTFKKFLTENALHARRPTDTLALHGRADDFAGTDRNEPEADGDGHPAEHSLGSQASGQFTRNAVQGNRGANREDTERTEAVEEGEARSEETPSVLRIAFIRRRDYREGNDESQRLAHRKRSGRRVITNHDALIDIARATAARAIMVATSTSGWESNSSRYHDTRSRNDHSGRGSGHKSSHGNVEVYDGRAKHSQFDGESSSSHDSNHMPNGHNDVHDNGLSNRDVAREDGDGQPRRWRSYEVSDLRLERMSFDEQVDALRRTDVLVAQYGTGDKIRRHVTLRDLIRDEDRGTEEGRRGGLKGLP